jgi:hypothetical protein
MLSGGSGWEKILRRCYPTRRVRRKHGDNVEPGVIALTPVFSSDIAQMINLFRGCLANLRQFDSIKDLCTNGPRWVSIAGRQFDSGRFVDDAGNASIPPNRVCMREAFCQLRNLVADFRSQMSDPMIVDLLVIKTRII